MSSPQKASDPLIGKVIDGRYEILERIGEGGMGVVYRSRQVSIDRIIAIKMLNKQMAQDPNWVERFYNEARACSRLQHPNTIRMFDFGQTREGSLFMTMEFLDGISLRQAIATGAPMAPARVLKILIQCCASLAEAHSLEIIHRDMKPDNVFLLTLAGSPDFVKVLDFSVAKLLQAGRLKTQAGVVFGTPQYMSPEQGRGLALDARSDLYGLGILAFEMLTGQVPFDDHNPMVVLQMHITHQAPPLPPSVPGPMREVVERALAKDPNQRFQSAQEMMQACQQAFAQVGSAAMHRAVATPMPQVAAPRAYRDAGPPPAMSHGGSAPAAASAKTVMATGLDALAGRPPADPSHSGITNAPAGAKTMMAPSLDSLSGPPPAPSFGPPFSGGSPLPGSGGGPAKTMMLQDSSGVVSFTGSGSAPVSRSGIGGGYSSGGRSHGEFTHVTPASGPSILFWAISLTSGVIIGVLAYLLLLKFTG